YRVLRVQELGQYNLEILSADLSDDALYECQAPDAALRSRRAKLTVLNLSLSSFSVPPDDPVIDGGPEVLLTAGESYNLTCVSRGAKPPSMVEWLKDGLPVEGAVSTTEVLPDRKRVTTRSYLPIHPVDTDTGRNYSCVATNLAAPSGKSTTVTLNVHRKSTNSDLVHRTSLCPRRGQSHLHLPGSCQPAYYGLQGARESMFTTKADHSFFTEPVSCLVFNAVGKTNVSILVDVHWPPIISSEPEQYAVRGDRGEVKCYIASTPPPDKIVWAWKENVWEKEKGTLLERYTVEQSKPTAEGGGVLSTLTINNVMESDFLSTYNCTAWNSFGPGTMIITLAETGRRGVTLGKPDIKVETITKETHSLEEDSGSVSTASRMPFKDDIELKSDLRSDTLETRQEYDLKDEVHPGSRSTLHYTDYRSPAGTPGGAASISSSTGGSGATASGGASVPPGPLTSPGRPQACYDPRPPSRLSHISYAQFNTFTRGGQSQQPPANPAPAATDFPGDCSLLDSNSQLAYDNYGYPSHYQTYRMGFAPSSLAPLEAGPSYEMYGVGSGVPSPGVAVSPGGQAPSGSETGLGKYGSSTRFSYTSQHSDYSHSRHTQRMQTHV
ncbi:hypothetical protein GOODEAATRI_012299, partial [Goodea atripinnis]